MSEITTSYNSLEEIKINKGQQDLLIMYLIVRKSLSMSSGKIAAQCGHAVGLMYGHYIKICSKSNLDNKDLHKISIFNQWTDSLFVKIVLQANDKQWKRLKQEQECFVARDAGPPILM